MRHIQWTWDLIDFLIIAFLFILQMRWRLFKSLSEFSISYTLEEKFFRNFTDINFVFCFLVHKRLRNFNTNWKAAYQFSCVMTIEIHLTRFERYFSKIVLFVIFYGFNLKTIGFGLVCGLFVYSFIFWSEIILSLN